MTSMDPPATGPLQANLAEVAKTIRLRISHIPSGECDWERKLHALEVIFR